MKYVEVAGQVANKDDDAVMMMGLISDTHGVYDEVCNYVRNTKLHVARSHSHINRIWSKCWQTKT